MGLLDSLKNLFGGGNAAPTPEVSEAPVVETPVAPEAPAMPEAPMADMGSSMDAPAETPVA